MSYTATFSSTDSNGRPYTMNSFTVSSNYTTANNYYAQINKSVYTVNTSITTFNNNHVGLGGGGFNSTVESELNIRNGGHGILVNSGITITNLYNLLALLGGGAAGDPYGSGQGGPGGGGGGGGLFGYATNSYMCGGNGGSLLSSSQLAYIGFIATSASAAYGGGGGGPGQAGETSYPNKAAGGGGGNGINYGTVWYDYFLSATNGNIYVINRTSGGGGYGGGNSVLQGFRWGGGGGGGGYGKDINTSRGGYSIYNTGTITNLYNVQGGATNIYGPLIYGGTLPTNYYVRLNSISEYGQLYCIGWSWPTPANGDSMNIFIDPASSHNGTHRIYANAFSGFTFTTLPRGEITLNGTLYYWTLKLQTGNVYSLIIGNYKATISSTDINSNAYTMNSFIISSNYTTVNNYYAQIDRTLYTVKTNITTFTNNHIGLGGGGNAGNNGGHGILVNSGITITNLYNLNALLGGGAGGDATLDQFGGPGGHGGPGGGGGAASVGTYIPSGYTTTVYVGGGNGGSLLNSSQINSLYYTSNPAPGYGGGGGGPSQAGETSYPNKPVGGGGGSGINYGGYFNAATNGNVYMSGQTSGGGGYGGGYSVLAGSRYGGGGGGGGYGKDINTSRGGYSVYNTGTITNLYNVQGGQNIYGPLFYGGTLPTNYYVRLNTISNYGQLYCIGWAWPTVPNGNSMNIFIDPASTHNSGSAVIYLNVFSGFTFTTLPSGSITLNGTLYYWNVLLQSTNVYRLYINTSVYTDVVKNTSATISSTISSAFYSGIYRHIAMTISGNTHTLYFDGSAVAINTSAGNLFSTYSAITQLFIGSSANLSLGYTGFIDDFKIWNRALPAADISSIYLANFIPIPFQPNSIPGITLWLDAMDSTITTTSWSDKSGFGYNLTGTGMSYPSNLLSSVKPSVQITNTMTSIVSFNSVPLTWFIIFNIDNTNSSGYYTYLSVNANTGPPGGFQFVVSPSNQFFISQYGGGGYTSPVISLNSIGLHLLTVRLNGNGSTYTNVFINYDGTNFINATTNQSVYSSGNLKIIQDAGSSKNFYISELILYNSNLTNTQIQQIEEFLINKWNINKFQPNSIPGITLWVDAAATNTLTLGDSNTVSAWQDLTGNTNLTSASNYPTYSATGLNGKPTISFAGTTGQYLSNLSPPSLYSSLSGFSYFIVLKKNTPDINSYSVPFSIFGNFTTYFGAINTVVYNPFFANGSYNSTGSNGRSYIDNFIILLRITISSGILTLTIYSSYNNTTPFTFTVPYNAGTAGSQKIYVGTSGVSNNDNFKGLISEILFYNSNLTFYQIQQIEGYMAWKWGIQTSLPTIHPYRSVAPYTDNTFYPTSIPGICLWLDAKKTTTLTLGASNTVTAWNDLTGNTNLTCASNHPTYTTLNGYPCLSFLNGSNAYPGFVSSPTSLYDGTTSLYVFSVLNVNSLATADNPTHFGIGNTGDVINIYDSNRGVSDNNGGSSLVNAAWTYNGSKFTVNNVATPKNSVILLETIFTSGNQTFYINGVAGTTRNVSLGTGTANMVYIGNTRYNQDAFAGYMFENIVYRNVVLTQNQRQQIEGYMAWKWGIQTSLPTIHPYYTAAPTIITPTAPSSILDSLSTTTKTAMFGAGKSAGAYGTKLLYSQYTGPILNIRNGTTNVSADFYADINGNLGTTYLAQGTSLSTWLAGATAYVVVWYDQTGNGNTASQIDTTKQPTYNTTSKVITFTAVDANNYNYFDLPDKTHPYGNSNYTYVSKFSTTNLYGGLFGSGYIIGAASATLSTIHGFGRWDTKYGDTWWGTDLLTSGTYADNNVLITNYDGSNKRIYINGTLSGTLAGSNQASLSTYNYIGTRGGYNISLGQSSNGAAAGTGTISYMYIIPTYLAGGSSDLTTLSST